MQYVITRKEVEMEKLLTAEQAAEILGIEPATLAVWRCTKRYDLKWIKVGRLCKYRASDVQAFIDSRTVS